MVEVKMRDKLDIALKLAFETRTPLLISGLAGIGKTERIRKFFTDKNMKFFELHSSQNEVADLIGIPIIKQENGESVVVWSPPFWVKQILDWIKDGYEVGILVDELNRGTEEVQKALFPLFRDYRLHQHFFDKSKVYIIGAINPANHKKTSYFVNEIDPAFANDIYLLELDEKFVYSLEFVRKWLEYAELNKFNESVIEFIKNFNKFIYVFPSNSDIRSTTPRSLEKFSRILYYIESLKEDSSYSIQEITNMIDEAAEATLGAETANNFKIFYRQKSFIIDYKEIKRLLNENPFYITDYFEIKMQEIKTEKLDKIKDKIMSNINENGYVKECINPITIRYNIISLISNYDLNIKSTDLNTLLLLIYICPADTIVSLVREIQTGTDKILIKNLNSFLKLLPSEVIKAIVTLPE